MMRPGNHHKLHLLLSPAFLMGLGLLALNDLYLKQAYGNWFTGKLSDFAGLFAFAIFWVALFPRYRKLIFIATATCFAWWKGPLSSPFIEVWNSLHIYSIGRVIDHSDLIALAALLPAWYLLKPEKKQETPITQNWKPALLALTAFLIFCSSMAAPEMVEYHFSEPALMVYKTTPALHPYYLKEWDSVYRDRLYFREPSNLSQYEQKGDKLFVMIRGISTEESRGKELRDAYWLKEQKESAIERERLKIKAIDSFVAIRYGKKLHVAASDGGLDTSVFNEHIQATIQNGLPEGTIEVKWPNGKPKRKGRYEGHSEQGKFVYYDNLGNIFKEATYSNGELIKEKIYTLYTSGENKAEDTKYTSRLSIVLRELLILLALCVIPAALGYVIWRQRNAYQEVYFKRPLIAYILPPLVILFTISAILFLVAPLPALVSITLGLAASIVYSVSWLANQEDKTQLTKNQKYKAGVLLAGAGTILLFFLQILLSNYMIEYGRLVLWEFNFFIISGLSLIFYGSMIYYSSKKRKPLNYLLFFALFIFLLPVLYQASIIITILPY